MSPDVSDTPQPSAKSGIRFDELYRLKGVVRTPYLNGVVHGSTVSHSASFRDVVVSVFRCSSVLVHFQQYERATIDPIATSPTQ